MTNLITQADFYKLPEVIACGEIQKYNPYGSKEHKGAHDTLGALMTSYIGEAKAVKHLGEY